MSREIKTPVPALDKGMKILEVLSRNQTPLTMSQIAKTLGYKVSEIQRMVEYLNTNGYILKNDQRGFYISSKFFALTSRMDIHQILVNKASPIMNRFALESRESVQLSILNDRELLLLVHTEGTRHLRFSIKPGMFTPYETISGRLLIAYLDTHEQEKFNLTDDQLRNLEDLKAAHEDKGYCVGESPCFYGVHKLTSLIPITNMDERAAFTCTFILPRGEDLDEYTRGTIEDIFEIP